MNEHPNGAGTILSGAIAVKQKNTACLCLPTASAENVRRTITVTLHDKFQGPDEEPLEVILDQALHVLNPKLPAGERASGTEQSWLVRISIRAVCEAIVQRGCLPIPLAVDLKHRGDRVSRRKLLSREDCLVAGNIVAFPGRKEEA